MLGYEGSIPREACRTGAELALRNAATIFAAATREADARCASLAKYLEYAGMEEAGKFILLLEAWVLSDLPEWAGHRGGWDDFHREFRHHEAKHVAANAHAFRYDRLPKKWPGSAGRSAAFSALRQSMMTYGVAAPRKDFRPKASFLHEKDACLYVEYNPDYDGGRFIAPAMMDADDDWQQDVRQALPLSAEMWLMRRQRLLGRLDTTWAQHAVDAIRQAFGRLDAAAFRQASWTFLLQGAGEVEPTVP